MAEATSMEQRQAWLHRVCARQQSRLTPEVRQQVQQRLAVHQRAQQQSATCERLELCQQQSAVAWRSAMSHLSPAVAKAPSAPGAPVLSDVDVVTPQLQRMSRLQQQCRVSRPAEDVLLDMVELRAEAVVTEPATADDMTLLRELRQEPDNDNARCAKFALYETYGETVQTIRGEMFAFWEETKADFSRVPRAGVEKQLTDLDCAQNMGVTFDQGHWFVYDMTRVAIRNNTLIGDILKGIRTKLELLAAEDDCPICLEPLSEAIPVTTLPCCHKVCKECWDNWSATKGAHALCPLCKHDSFMEAIVELTPAAPALQPAAVAPSCELTFNVK